MSGFIHWFTDSPDEGEPDCLCSYCLEVIEDNEENDGPAIRMWRGGTAEEARFHDKCFNACLENGLLKIIEPRR